MSGRRTTFATRLFVALFLLSALPSVALLGLATWGLRNYVELAGDVDAWSDVGRSGQELLAAIRAADPDSTLGVAAARHERELSRSVALARRFDLVASRLAGTLPWFALALGLALAALALWAARSLARELSRPVDEIVDWAGRLARGEPLPERGSDQPAGTREFVALKRAFREMADQLAEGRRQAVEAERLRTWTEMARRVAHELKNPLTPLGLAIHQARGALASGTTGKLEDALRVIDEEAGRLDETARSFAQFGRLPEGPTSEIDLEELLGRLLRSDLPAAVDSDLRVEGVTRVEGHLTALERVFRNLLANAVEAVSGRGNGHIEITVRGENATVEVAIADNGPGVPPEQRGRIWDPDFTTRKRGTGIGLALVRQTVRAHGGEVELQDAEVGARFVVRLPVRQDGAV